ncbi:MAG: PorV/PorQ family protein [bacterium]|nr:PorV/PorQ family protein [bacterium]
MGPLIGIAKLPKEVDIVPSWAKDFIYKCVYEYVYKFFDAFRFIVPFLFIYSIFAIFVKSMLAQGAGGQAGQFLSWGAGARSLGMGRAYTSIADDSTAVYWNPAGLGQLERREFLALQADLPDKESKYQFVSLANPIAGGVLGVGYVKLTTGGFKEIQLQYDQNSGNIFILETEKTFENHQTAIIVGFGRKATDKLYIGASVKQLDNKFTAASDNLWSFMTTDIGSIVRFSPSYSLGINIQNIFSQTGSQDTDDKLPIIIKLGNSFKTMQDRLTVALDLNKNISAGQIINLGIDFKASSLLALRLGLESGDRITETTAGVGLNARNYGIDYAFGMHELGMSHRISAYWKIGGKRVRAKQEADINKLIEEANVAIMTGNFSAALDKLTAALAIDPTNRALEERVNKLRRVLAAIPAATGDERVDSMIKRGVQAWITGDAKQAANILRAASEELPQNERLYSLAANAASEAGMPPPPRTPGAMKLIDQKLYEALQAVYDNKFDIAIAKCQEVLNIDPDNVVALGRMGSTFYLMGERDKAIRYWKEALKRDPTNKVVIEYLKAAGETP